MGRRLATARTESRVHDDVIVFIGHPDAAHIAQGQTRGHHQVTASAGALECARREPLARGIGQPKPIDVAIMETRHVKPHLGARVAPVAASRSRRRLRE